MKQFRHILVGSLIDGSGGPARQGVIMTLGRGRIVSIVEASVDDVKPGAVEDLRSFTVLPGFVDAHVHLAISGTENAEDRKAQRKASFEEAAFAVEAHLSRHIRHGVVAVRDGGDKNGYALLYKKRFLEGRSVPVAVKAAGQAWHAPGRYGSLIGTTPQTGENLEEAITRSAMKSDHVKIVNSGLNSLSRFGDDTAPQFSLDELENAVKKAHALGRKVMIHANGRVPVGIAVEAGCDSIEHGFFMGRENLEKMARMGTIWVPTACTMAAYVKTLPKNSREAEVARRNLDHQLEQIRTARTLGVQIAAGTDSGSLGVHHGRGLLRELRLLMTAGFRLEEAVKCASGLGAALLGVESHTGTLAPGRPATFVVVRAAPASLLQNLDDPDLIVVKGKEVQGGKGGREGFTGTSRTDLLSVP